MSLSTAREAGLRPLPTPATAAAWGTGQGCVAHEGSSRAAVATTGRPAQSSPRLTAFTILDASQRKGMHEGRAYHERGLTSILGAR